MAIRCKPKMKLLIKDPYRSLPDKELIEVEEEESAFQSNAKKEFSILYFAFCMFSAYQNHPTAYQIDFSIIANEVF